MGQYSKNLVLELDGSLGVKKIIGKLKDSWNYYLMYHIYNVAETDYITCYENLANELGTIEPCRPVNHESKKVSKSRDIRPDPNLYHFYAANTRQPLHSDYAYFPANNSPDWVLMYCLKPSKLGGTTRFISASKIKEILKMYYPELLKKLTIDVTWSYIGTNGDEIHKKPIFNGEQINWNYWQIKSDLNSQEVMNVRKEFFEFLENVIVDGNIYDFSKVWSRGDLVIWNDKKMLHGRDAFLGDRWLKDHALFNHK